MDSKKLGGADDRVGDRGVLDQLLLGNLRPELATGGQALSLVIDDTTKAATAAAR